MGINTDKFSEKLRSKVINLHSKRILITRFSGSEQENDLSEPPNCNGYGRIRHFKRKTSPGWPENPLPIDPAWHKLGTPVIDLLRAQAFQSSACNWRCWYCFVPFDLLSANPKNAAWFSASDLLDLYQRSVNRPNVIDLSGGQPDLSPEWIPWMMRELQARKLDGSVYLWSDDNLSTDFFWRFLTSDDINLIRNYRNYGKVCSFKGFDPDSFAFNTGAAPQLFNRQFQVFKRYLEIGLDIYAYATFTSKHRQNIHGAMTMFVDRLQSLHSNLPLRTIPLKIKAYSPTKGRLKPIHEDAIRIQQDAIGFWNEEIQARFSPSQRQLPIFQVPLT